MAGPVVARGAPAAPLADALDALLACVHCGFCLPACPTYELLGDENDAPRGRLVLMRAVAEGELAPDDSAFALHIDRCLGCRACEPACPSGVRYGFLLERARAVRAARPGLRGRLARFVLRTVFARPRVARAAWAAARAIRATRVPDLVARLGVGRPGRLRYAAAMLAGSRRPRELRVPPGDGGEGARPAPTAGEADARAGAPSPADVPRRTARERVALLLGCVMDGLLRETNAATRRALEAAGAEVVEIPGGVCCGALHAHAGDLDGARALARRVVRAFVASGATTLVTNSAGCGAAMREYGEWLADDPDAADAARRTGAAVRDVSEWLGDRVPPGLRPHHRRVAYDAPCHLLHAQGVREPPLRLLRAVPGLEVVELERADRCCGAAGLYSMLQPRLSRELLARKLEEIREADPDLVATGNPGCLLHLAAGLRLAGLARPAVVHPVECLAAACP